MRTEHVLVWVFPFEIGLEELFNRMPRNATCVSKFLRASTVKTMAWWRPTRIELVAEFFNFVFVKAESRWKSFGGVDTWLGPPPSENSLVFNAARSDKRCYFQPCSSLSRDPQQQQWLWLVEAGNATRWWRLLRTLDKDAILPLRRAFSNLGTRRGTTLTGFQILFDLTVEVEKILPQLQISAFSDQCTRFDKLLPVFGLSRQAFLCMKFLVQVHILNRYHLHQNTIPTSIPHCGFGIGVNFESSRVVKSESSQLGS